MTTTGTPLPGAKPQPATPAPTISPQGPITGVKSPSGFNVLLMGPAGTGKTHSIGTLVDAGIETFYLSLETGVESLLGYYSDRGKPIPPNLHWHEFDTQSQGFASMISTAEKINQLALDSLAKMVDPNKSKYNQFVQLLKALSDFPDDRTGQKFGAVDSWDSSRALVIDGLTGLGNIAMSLVVGGKAVKNQSDWGIAQGQVETILRQLCDGCKCHFVLLAHVDREIDQVMGGSKITVATLGAKLAPKIPPMFSDVILAARAGTTWTWDTASAIADVKTRNLPFKADNPPSFGPIVTKWKARTTAALVPTEVSQKVS